jgi:hypothetical protein
MLRLSFLIKAAVSCACTVLLYNAALAGGAVFWEISKQEDIVKGDARGVSISDHGLITLAPSFTVVYDTKEAYIWSSAADRAGNLYLGTGHEGRVFKVDPSGSGRMLFDSPELDVTALTTDPKGNLYAGTSPDGKIYKIAPDGTSSVFFDPSDKYIWSLVFDNRTSSLYAGTGDKGIIYKIDAAGKDSVLVDTNETNIVSLALDSKGNLLAGTDPTGLVLRIGPDKKTFALVDSPMQEIHSLAVTSDGSIFALGVNPQGSSQRSGTIGTSSTTSISSEGVITISADDQDTPGSQIVDLSGLQSQSKGKRNAEGARSALIKIPPDGGSDVPWRSNDAVGFAMRPLPDGRVLVGTGEKGRIYLVSADRSRTLLIQSPEDQTSTILAVGDKLYATSSNLGRLYSIGREPGAEGSYTSPVHDTKSAGKWGVINWRGAGNVELQTRTGNTESPDATWSDWSPPYRNPNGDQITSPVARFIQWRATLRETARTTPPRVSPSPAVDHAGPIAELDSVVIAYLPKNQAPEINSVTMLPPGVALQETPLAIDPSIAASGLDPQLFGLPSNVPARRFFQRGARSLSWQATDRNDDSLVYRVFYRTVKDNDWHLLADNLTQMYYTIDGNRLADGSYVFKVEASDAPSNPAELALTTEEISDAVEIDNTPPSINQGPASVSGQTTEVTFEATDTTSRVVRGEYSVDGGQWRLIFPVDGIADSASESFKVSVKLDRPGEHVIAFRAADSSGNIGTSKVTVVAK